MHWLRSRILTSCHRFASIKTMSKDRFPLKSVGDSCIVNNAGLYGLSVGSLKRRSTCPCSLSLVVEPMNKNRVHHNLPFHVHDKALFSLEYGRLLFLESNCTVTVKWNGTPSHHHLSDPCDLQWQLVLHKLENFSQSSSLKCEHEPQQSGNLYDRPKCIVCTHCNRTFSHVHSAQTHFNDHHKQQSAVWNQPLNIVYQDNEMAVVDKPQGISVQGGEGKTLQRSDLLLPMAGPDKRKPIIVHRLDAATGGLLVMAKTKESERFLRMAFAQQRCQKRYRAVVFGRIKADSGVICEPVSGKPAETRYRVISRTPSPDPRADGYITTVDLFPISGRKHQIRRHLKHIGHPIWGDKRYAKYTKDESTALDDELSEENKLDQLFRTTVEQDPHSRLCLWAMEISVPHPKTNEMVNVALSEEPKWISSLIAHEERRFMESLGQDPQTQ